MPLARAGPPKRARGTSSPADTASTATTLRIACRVGFLLLMAVLCPEPRGSQTSARDRPRLPGPRRAGERGGRAAARTQSLGGSFSGGEADRAAPGREPDLQVAFRLDLDHTRERPLRTSWVGPARSR